MAKQEEKQFKYDVSIWDHEYEEYEKEWKWTIDGNKIKRTDLEKAANFQDATQKQKWNRDVQIQTLEYKTSVEAFNRSEKNYERQLAFNNLAAAQAFETERAQYEELKAEASFDKQDELIKTLQSEGAARAQGISGRSASKAASSILAQEGRNIAILNESMLNANKQHMQNLAKIATDKYGADMNAYAKRLLKPSRPPAVPMPFKTPVAFLQDPLKRDKPPKPIKGAAAKGMGTLGKIGQVLGIAASVASLFSFSDDRLKYDITRVGTSKKGIPKYTFKYRQDGKHGPTYIGTSAQDLIKMGREDAVVQKEKGGFYMVDYSKIDVNFEQIS